jgi:hypothetical protein
LGIPTQVINGQIGHTWWTLAVGRVISCCTDGIWSTGVLYQTGIDASVVVTDLVRATIGINDAFNLRVKQFYILLLYNYLFYIYIIFMFA